jgi:hypothetical protein
MYCSSWNRSLQQQFRAIGVVVLLITSFHILDSSNPNLHNHLKSRVVFLSLKEPIFYKIIFFKSQSQKLLQYQIHPRIKVAFSLLFLFEKKTILIKKEHNKIVNDMLKLTIRNPWLKIYKYLKKKRSLNVT